MPSTLRAASRRGAAERLGHERGRPAKTQLTKWGGDFSPARSPGGKQIVYCVTQGVQVDVFIMNTDGSGARNVTDSERV